MKYARFFTILFILAGMFMFTACEEKELNDISASNNEADKYKVLLDYDHWMGNLDIEEYEEYIGEDWMEFMDVVLASIGFEKWEQVELSASLKGDEVHLTSVLRYDKEEGEESLSAFLLDWKPGDADLLRGIQRENLIGLLALGNPTGLLDAKMKWLIDSDLIGNLLDAFPLPDDVAQIRLGVGAAKMTAKGYWYEAKEKYYPLIGDEIIIAVFSNKDFKGWDNYWEAESYAEVMPVKPLIAIELGEPGLVEVINEAVDDYIGMFKSMSYSMSDDEMDEFFKIHKQRAEGYEIYYFDFEGEFQIAWTEYEGALFVSDLETIEDLPDYFNPNRKTEIVMNRYNEYLYFNMDEVMEHFGEPLRRSIDEAIASYES